MPFYISANRCFQLYNVHSLNHSQSLISFFICFPIGSTPTSTKGEVVVDKTETRVKTDHQIVEPNGETTHLEHENVDTVEKTKPASDPVESSREEVVPVGGAAPAADPVEVAEDPAPQGEVDAAVRNDNDDLLQADAGPGEVDKQQGSPFAHDGEILLEDWQFICKFFMNTL